MHVAIYARYSSDLQRETSIEDQIAVARRYVEERAWAVLEDHIYTDAAVSGSSIDGRSGLQALLTASERNPRPFDVLLVDDSSRIARDLADALRTMQLLKFREVRVIYISQGIDSSSEQADSLIAMHGLVDSLYLKELAKKVKRGLAGQLERGFVTGNKTYGYRTVGVPSGKTDVNGNVEFLGKRRVIHEEEAQVIRQIFEWTASGLGVFTIIRRLQVGVPGPWGRPWTQSTIRRILENEVYLGRLIWGRVNHERQPGTNKKVRRTQPRTAWKVSDQPELRIISDDLWEKVRQRQHVVRTALKGNFARGRLPGYQSKYLFSGFMKCGKCGGSIVVVSSGKIAGPRYGCLKAKRQYSCGNDIEMSLKKVETRLLDRLQAELQKPEVADYIIRETIRRSQEAPAQSNKCNALKKELERERNKLQNLVRALEDGEPSSTVLTAIRSREENVRKLEGQLAALRPITATKVAVEPARIRQELENLQSLLQVSAERARPVFKKLNLQVRLFPVERAGERPYWRAVATCQLDALTGEMNLYPSPTGRRKGEPTDPEDGAAGPLPTVRRSLERVVSVTPSPLPMLVEGGSGAE